MIFLPVLMTSLSKRGKCGDRKKVLVRRSNPASMKSSTSHKQKEVVVTVNREKLNYVKTLKGQQELQSTK